MASHMMNPGGMLNFPWLTKLSPLEEMLFQRWVKASSIPWVDTPLSDYDMRGYFKAMLNGDPRAQRNPENRHFPDIWKTPFHQYFSNESQYATPKMNAPHWEGPKGQEKLVK